jgi:serine/threonine-protein kinase HipA
MTKNCLACLGEIENGDDYHAKCAKTLFGSAIVPRLNIEVGKLHTAALAMIGKTSISGVQKKISVNISADRLTLQIASERGFYILKPPTDTYPSLPENEHITMLLAHLSRVNVGEFGLIRIEDGLAFLTKRFDRSEDGRKLHQEDFCQLESRSPSEKYNGSGELCARVIKRFASEPGIEMLKLFEQLGFSWWISNGDLHLKNLSLMIDLEGLVKLTPAYDLVSTHLVMEGDPLALPICGRDRKLQRSTWIKFAKYCGIGDKAACRVLDRQASVLANAHQLIDSCYLPQTMKKELKDLTTKRTASIIELGE